MPSAMKQTQGRQTVVAVHPPTAGAAVSHHVEGLPRYTEIASIWSRMQTAWSISQARYGGSSEVCFEASHNARQTTSGAWAAAVEPVQVFVEDEDCVADLIGRFTVESAEHTELVQLVCHPVQQQELDCGQESSLETLVVLQQPVEQGKNETNEDRKAYTSMLVCQLTSTGLRWSFNFDQNQQTMDQARRMMQQLEHILRQVCVPEHATQKIGAVEWASQQDLADIWNWNANVPSTIERCFQDLFAEVAQRQPQSPAVCAWDGEWTYAELDARSTKLAYHLVALGVGPDVVVPICFEKSKWVPLAVLGVTKAGGASVVMDATLPDERLRSIAARAQAPVILASLANQDRAGLISNSPVVVPELLMQETVSSVKLPQVQPSNKLYVVFTSGSTGTPKGAIITHSNFSSAIHHQRAEHYISSSSRVYDFASYAFDVSWLNLLHFLAAGACVCIPSQEERQNDIAGSMRRLRVNWAQITPSVGRLIEPSEIPNLECLVFSGEAMTAQDVEHWKSMPRLINTYGPAECTVTTTVGEVDRSQKGDPTIGWGSAACTWVVERSGASLSPLGTIGELWLEGPLVGQGYLSDPEKTAMAFFEDPPWLLRGGPGHAGRRGRLYRTGDLVRYNTNGSLAFLGRKDSQVKIRGQRVELGEIEHHVHQSLANGADLRVVADVLTPVGSNNVILVAFMAVTGASGEVEDPIAEELNASIQKAIEGINERMAERVPTYMIPAAFIAVQRLPMTATGKTDRRRLREVGASLAQKQLNADRSERREPTTEMELRLRELWAKVLRMDAANIGADDSFLRLGGDSLAAMRLVGLAREHGLRLTVAMLFEHPHLSNLARNVHTTTSTEEQSIAPFSLLKPVGENDIRTRVAGLLGVAAQQIEDVFPCTPLQEGLLALSAKNPGSYVGRMALELREPIDLDRFHSAWEEVIATTPILRTRIVSLASQGIVQAVVAEPAQWTDSSKTSTLDQARSMGFGTPLIRFGIAHDRTSGQRYLTCVIHHALYDGWSMPLVFNQLERVYHQAEKLSLAPLQPFVKHILSHDPRSVSAFWQSQLEGCEATLFPALPSKTYEPRADRTMTRDVAGLEWPTTDVTASTAIRTALSILLAQHTATDDVVFGATVIGRQAAVAGVEQMAGPAIATVPIRVQVDREASVAALLQQIQLQTVRMTEYEQTGLQGIRRVSRELEQASQFQTLAVIQPAPREEESSIFKKHAEGDAVEELGTIRGVEEMDNADEGNTYALEFTFLLQADGVQINISFDSAVIADSQAECLAQQLEHILRQVCAPEHAAAKIAAVQWTSQQDQQDIWTRNATVPRTIERCVHDLIADKVREQPNAPAVRAWNGDWTYAELDAQSTRLAHYLIACGLERGHIVPLCFEKSKWTPVAVLAVMKAGGASIAMDTAVPDERLRTIMDQADGPIILSSATSSARATKLSETATVVVPETLGDIETQSQSKLPTVSPSDKLYINFTSGSTGTPKGAIISHSNFSSAIYHQGQSLGFDASCRVYDFASYAFDTSWSNTLHTLAHGACICIPSQADRQDRVAESIKELQANYLDLTPSVTRLLDPASLPDIQHILFGGELLLAEDVAKWQGVPRLSNTYGPAECTVNTTICDISNGTPDGPSIGNGVGTNTWIVDIKTETPALMGGVGELWLEGPLVGQGYLADPHKTAAVFVTDPQWLLAGGPGYNGRRGRMYKTGDLVRYNPDGTIGFIGRKDAQVKIHGQRVELGDVAHHVKQELPSDCQVVAEIIKPQGSSSSTLAAFINAASKPEWTDEDYNAAVAAMVSGLEEELSQKLPAYMVPTVYIPTRHLPMTTTGKTDRRQLREMGASMTLKELGALVGSQSESREPTTEMELRLRDLWASILDIDINSISAADNFLRIGGDSIAAMRLAGAAREQGLDVPVATQFEYPRLCDLAAVIKPLAGAESEEIKPFALLQGNADAAKVQARAAKLCGLEPNQVEDVFPCTPLQEGLLALTTRRPGDYIHREVFNLRKDVNVDRFRAAWEEVVAATPILRTRIANIPEQGMVQVVTTEPMHWRNHSGSPQDLKAMTLGAPLAHFGLDYGRNDGQRYFIWTIHHALYDGWSMPLVLEQVENAYKGEPMKALAKFQPFVKYIRSLQPEPVEAYWRGQFQDSEASVFPALPSKDHQPQVNGTIAYQVSQLEWPTNGITAATMVRAAWSIVAARYTDADDVIFGATMSGRQADVVGIERMAGPTVATVPVRVRVGRETTTEDFLRQVQAQATEMVDFEQTGLSQIRRYSPDLAQASQFQTLIVVQPADKDADEESAMFKEKDNAAGDAQQFSAYALEMVCQLQHSGLELNLHFDSEVLPSNQVERLAQQLEHVLRQLCAPQHATEQIASVEWTSQQDKRDVWNWYADVPSTIERCVHDIFGDVVRKQPEAPAVCAWDGEFTYAELDTRSTKLAHHLVSLGVGPEVIVPLFFEKSKWMPVAILGVMKAGGASVAMDTTLPDERLRSIAKQVNGPVILSSVTNAARAVQLSNLEAIVVSEAMLQRLPNQQQSKLPTVHPSNKLYVVFTSGSTGTPKGAIVAHSNFASAIHHQQERLGFRADSRVFDFSSYAFDVSWSNTLRSLAAGACLCIPSQGDRQNRIAESIQELRANFLDMTPSVSRLLDQSKLPKLQNIIFGGEFLLEEDVNRWRAVPRLTNAYGPAECSVCATANPIDYNATGNPSLGKGTGQNTWVVDRSGTSLASVGSIGELWLEGPLVGQGYLSDPEKTAAAFVVDPPWLLAGGPNHPGRRGRLYKTGDLVRCNVDGTLTFIGRKDAQVKIHGQRIELDDVAYHVRRNLTSDEDCQVVAEVIRPEGSSNSILAAFISLATDSLSDEDYNTAVVARLDGLNGRLAEQLAPYMIPTVQIPIRSLPMTATGKTDRRRLREIGASSTLQQFAALVSAQGERRAPSTQLEMQLQAAWAAVLRIDATSISADDSFLQLGGDSIAAMQLVTAAREQGLSFTVADLFRNPRLCDLAAVTQRANQAEPETIAPFSLLQGNIEAGRAQEWASELCGLTAAQIEDVFPCTPLQEGLLALSTRRAGDYVNRAVFELQDQVDLDRFRAAWEDVVAATPILRTRIVDLPQQGLVQAVTVGHIEWLPAASKGQVMGLGTPLVQFSIENAGSSNRRFIWTIHHALYDGWSLPLVLEQVERAYTREARAPLSPFQPFVKSILALDDGKVEQYWRSQLGGSEASPFPALPSKDHQPRSDSTVDHQISQISWPKTGITPATVVRAAWSILVARYTDTPDIVFGATVTGRQAAVANIERLAGPTVATVPVRVRVAADGLTQDFLQKVQTQAMDMTEFEQTGLSRIRRIAHDLEQASHFQTLMFIQPAKDDNAKASTVFKGGEAGDEADTLSTFNTYALTLTCQLEASGMHLNLSFDSAVIENRQARRMAQQLEHILRQLCIPENAAETLAALNWVSDQDLQDVWSRNAAVPLPAQECVHDIINTITQQQPQAPAVCAWDGELTYAELDEQSTRLAHHLVAHGVGPNVIVPLCFEKSKWHVVAVMGVMKAGGASVAMDTLLPNDRLHAIASQVKGPVICSSTANASRASEITDGAVLVPEAMMQDEVPSTQLPIVAPSNILYVVFTSGSTGTPKGAMISHDNLASASRNQNEDLGFNNRSRAYDFASYAFDISWSNNLRTLTAGGCICIPSQADRQNDIAGSINRLKANMTDLTTSVARLIDPADIPGLEQLIFCGEPVRARDAAQWKDLPKVLNVYGPAECTIHAMVHPVDSEQPGDPPIGRGTGTLTWIADREGKSLVPVGGIGELCLEGPSVGLGYLGDLNKTAAAFVEDPPWLLAGGPGHPGRHGRVYKTGDLVRYNPDGTLAYLGRKDAQVKIRGQRVELGDIDHHVRQKLAATGECTAVSEVVTPEASGNPILVAFIATDAADGQDDDKLRAAVQELTMGLSERLAERLPSYMIPTAYIPMRKIPMTPTGKVDRKTLKTIGAAMTLEELGALVTAGAERREPSTEMELRLQDLWATVLGINPASISADDSFIRIGGDSIVAMRLVTAAQAQGISFGVADLFKHPRLCDLAAIAKHSTASHEDRVAPFSLLKGDTGVTEIQKQAAALCGLDATQVEDVFPCTPLQEGLLALTAKNPGSYVHRSTFELQDNVNLDQFCAAWEQVVAATPILRTRIIDLPGEGLVQVVAKETVRWLWPGEDGWEGAPMTLGTPLVCLGLNKGQRGERPTFAWTTHHAVYDGWSLPLVLDQVEKAYKKEETEALSQFQPFVKHILSLDDKSVQEYWHAQLDSCEAAVFPALPSKAYQPSSDQTLSHTITGVQWPHVDSTASAVIRTAWSILASRYTDSRDVVFGVTVAGRQAPVTRVEEMAGPTIATVPVRVRVDEGKTVAGLLEHVQTQAVDMIQFEQTGLQRIRRMGAEMEQASQFQTLMVIQPAEEKATSDSQLFVEDENDGDAANSVGAFNNYALMLVAELGTDSLQLTLNFDSAVMDIDQAARMAQQLEHILRQLCATENEQTRISAVEWTSPQDKQDVWTRNASVPSTIERCVHELVAEETRKRPHAQAVRAWDGDWTYAELDVQSTRLAQHLVARGVGPGSIVPLCFEKSKWVPVAMMGVMKAGAAVTAMDTAVPDERLRTIVGQVEGPVILASIAQSARAAGLSDQAKVIVPETLEDFGRPTESFPAVKPSDILYVVFTSGSTGTPKGVVITHANFSSAVLHQGGVLGFSSSARIYDFVSYAFDIAMSNNLRTLAVGACICIPNEDDRQNAITRSINELGANWVVITPSVARSLNPADLPDLEHLVFGGEALMAEDVREWKSVPRLLNGYGPAECTVMSTVFTVDKEQTVDPSIGWSVGLNAWVVDREGKSLVSVGGIGELLLEGPLVSPGYLYNPEKTAQAFIENPEWLMAGGPGFEGRRGRLYKTGDIVRYNPDGSLTFLGRKDAQVKIRGQRVELGDIEHHMRRNLGGSAGCRVVAEVIKPLGSSSAVLAAFISIPSSVDQTEEEYNSAVAALLDGLDEKLAQRLPVYMVPAVYVPMRQIPMGTTGKTDRKKLLEIGSSSTLKELGGMTAGHSTMRAPSTEMEFRLRDLWATVLSTDAETIGADDTFIQAGGDSIAAMRLVRAAGEQGWSMTVADIFEHQKLCDLAAVLEHAVDEPTQPEPFSLIDAGSNVDQYLDKEIRPLLANRDAEIVDVLPVTDFQKACMDMGETVALRKGYHFFVDLPQGTRVARLRDSCQELCDHIDILRTVFVQTHDKYLQVVLKNMVPRVDIYKIEGDMATECQEIYEKDLQELAPFGSSFLRFIITHGPEGNVRLTIRLSHAQYDGISLGPLMACLAACYRQLDVASVPGFGGYIKHALQQQEPGREYWRSLLEGSQMTYLPPPTPKDLGPQETEQDTLEIRMTVPAPPTRSGVTPAALFTTLAARAIAKVTNSSDITMGMVVSGRAKLPSALQHVIGPCVNILPIRTRADATAPIESTMASVQDQLVKGMQFETSFFSDIVTHCTDWPSDTKDFGFLTEFLELDQTPGVQSSGLQGTVGWYDRLEARQDQPSIVVKPVNGAWELNVRASKKIHGRTAISRLVGEFVSLVTSVE